MNISLQLDNLILNIGEATQEEALNVLGLLINTGVIPSDDLLDLEIDDEDEDEEFFGIPFGCACECEEEEGEQLSFPFASLQDILAEALEAAEKEEQAKKKQEEPTEEEVVKAVGEILGMFFNGLEPQKR